MVGMPALIEFESFEENARLCKTLGLDFIEINTNLPIYNQFMNLNEIKRCMIEYNIDLTMHLSETFDPFDLDPVIRNARIKSFIHTVERAAELGVSLLNMHMSKGIHFTLPNQKVFLYEKYIEEYLRYVKEFKHIVDDLGLKLCIENTGIHDLEFIRRATDILLDSDNIFLTYDIGHDITSGYRDKLYYERHLNKIVHYHIHDATTISNHLELYTGDLDIDYYIKYAKITGSSCVIEVKSSKELIASLNKISELHLCK